MVILIELVIAKFQPIGHQGQNESCQIGVIVVVVVNLVFVNILGIIESLDQIASAECVDMGWKYEVLIVSKPIRPVERLATVQVLFH